MSSDGTPPRRLVISKKAWAVSAAPEAGHPRPAGAALERYDLAAVLGDVAASAVV
jgi:hypothetical protein